MTEIKEKSEYLIKVNNLHSGSILFLFNLIGNNSRSYEFMLIRQYSKTITNQKYDTTLRTTSVDLDGLTTYSRIGPWPINSIYIFLCIIHFLCSNIIIFQSNND